MLLGAALTASLLYAHAQQAVARPASASPSAVDAMQLYLVAHDKIDKPVLDLKPDDLTITDDGSPVRLDNLRLVDQHQEPEQVVSFVFDPFPAEKGGRPQKGSSRIETARDADAQSTINRYNRSARNFAQEDNMKRFGWILLLVAAAPTLLSASSKKMTVAEFQDVLTGLHNSRKSDEQVANELKQIELTEELTPAAMSSMVKLVDGPLSNEQMYVLEARSAMLAPPDTDLPKAAPPDAAAQRVLLAKAVDYAVKAYSQLPRLTAARLVARFQDGVETIQSYGGTQVKVQNDSDPFWEQISHYTRLVNIHTDEVEIDNGIEKPGGKDTTPWGRNSLVNSMLPFLPLNLLTSEAVSLGKPKFLRWETIAGHQTAVFAFAVDKKKSHYAINYCCFPETSSVGGGLYGGRGKSGGGAEPSGGAGLGGLSASPLAHPAGNGSLANVSDFKPFNAKSGYHGELFLDPDSGVVVRTILEAEFKPSDFVHYENLRVDYAPMPIGGNNLYVPVRSFTIAEIVPNGDSFVRRYAVRLQFVTQDYKDIKATDGTYQVQALRTQSGKTVLTQGGKTTEPGASFALSGIEDVDDPPPSGSFPALESISRPAGPLAIAISANPFQRPPDDELKSLLAEAAQNANDYWDSLPNFTCQQVTERFAGSNGKNNWEHIDTLTGQLNYFDRQEDWEFQEYEKDHKKSHDSSSNPGRGISEFGIFGGVIRGLFRPAAKAEISWLETDALGDGTVQVFKYRVAKENSNLALRGGDNQVVLVGYHGIVYIDSATRGVRRITQIADEVPKRYPIHEALVSADYDYVAINGLQYLLPIGAQIVLRRGSQKSKLDLNQIRFRDFHRFRSTSRILSSTPTSAP